MPKRKRVKEKAVRAMHPFIPQPASRNLSPWEFRHFDKGSLKISHPVQTAGKNTLNFVRKVIK